MNSLIQYCPVCGKKQFHPRDEKSWQCGACGFLFYRNPATAVAAIIECHGELLFAVRGRDPQAGKLDLPGGFVDLDESAEQALQRELGEELGLQPVAANYMASFPNTYPYAGVDYRTVDLVYRIELARRPELQAADDIVATRWIAMDAIPFEQVAFKSTRNALRHYIAAAFHRQ